MEFKLGDGACRSLYRHWPETQFFGEIKRTQNRSGKLMTAHYIRLYTTRNDMSIGRPTIRNFVRYTVSDVETLLGLGIVTKGLPAFGYVSLKD